MGAEHFTILQLATHLAGICSQRVSTEVEQHEDTAASERLRFTPITRNAKRGECPVGIQVDCLIFNFLHFLPNFSMCVQSKLNSSVIVEI